MALNNSHCLIGAIANGQTILPVVKCMIIAHWAQDGKLHESHVTSISGNLLIAENNRGLFDIILAKYSRVGQTVLSLNEDSDVGKYTCWHTYFLITYL